ncbi:MAG: CoB--CoM heterodisulfide reductase subunit B [Candidatus Freyarchaeota archaeon]|nr:CoB--CoM heterodisulfide reductase subunit B [Candidatus Freyrarchaeum guaymaensis]
MSRYAYFLGCLTPNRYPGIETATIDLLRLFDIEVDYMKGTSCCPAPGVFGSFDLNTWIVIAARNITIAEDMGADITLTCNGCYATLQEADHMLKHNRELVADVNRRLAKVGREYKGTVNVIHIMEILYKEIGPEKIRDMVVQPLEGVKVACHYGCHFLKPSDIRQQGNPENPTMMEELIEAIGAEPVEYRDKNMCCGAGGGVRAGKIDLALDMTRRKIDAMMEAGADCVVTPCVFCHFQFDVGQAEINNRLGAEKYKLPVVFITQLIGLALGMSPRRMGLHRNRTQVKTLLDKVFA